MVWYRICGLALLFLLLASHSIHAYERDVHYDLTKHLARWAGFSEDEAEQIATADQEIDAKPEFNPLPNLKDVCPELRKIAGPASAIVAIPVACKNDPEFQRMLTAQRAYHFVDSERLQALRESAFREKNLKILGHYLHALQDTFAHSLMDYADLPPLDKLVANLGHLPDAKIIGHLLYGHSLDKTYERPDLAEHMAQYVYAELVRFKGSVNRWNELEATVARFVREKDLQRQVRYLSASSPPSPPVASSQPSGLPTKAQEPMHEGRTFVEWQADLRDSSPKVREKAALALGHFGPKAVPILTQTLQDGDANVRWAAAHALGEIGAAAKDAVPALVRALEDPEAMVRGSVEYALGQIDPSVLENREQAEKAAAEEEARLRNQSAQRQTETEETSQRRPVRERWQAFWSKHKITDAFLGSGRKLCTNPFAFEGKIVAIIVQFEGMVARDRAIFDDGWGCHFAVSAIPKGTFSTERWWGLMAAEVLGQTEVNGPRVQEPVAHLRFVGFHVCKDPSCDDIIPSDVRGFRWLKGVHCQDPACTE